MGLNASSELRLAGPAREVPLSARARFLFGGFLNQLGWFFLGFGLVFARVFAFQADLSGWWAFRGPLESSPARVTSVRSTHSSENKRQILAYDYVFTHGAATFHGTSYSPTGGPAAGPADVEYPAFHPETSRLAGMRRRPFGAPALFTLIFPLLGLGFVSAGLRKGLRGIRLLRRGVTTEGSFLRQEATNTTVNNRRVYRLTYRFKTLTGEERAVAARSEFPEKFSKIGDEPLVYDPADPANAMLLDDLPGRPRLDADSVTRTEDADSWAYVFVPGLAVAGHLLWWLLAR